MRNPQHEDKHEGSLRENVDRLCEARLDLDEAKVTCDDVR